MPARPKFRKIPDEYRREEIRVELYGPFREWLMGPRGQDLGYRLDEKPRFHYLCLQSDQSQPD